MGHIQSCADWIDREFCFASIGRGVSAGVFAGARFAAAFFGAELSLRAKPQFFQRGGALFRVAEISESHVCADSAANLVRDGVA